MMPEDRALQRRRSALKCALRTEDPARCAEKEAVSYYERYVTLAE